jgi:hypothetical protein
MRVQRRSAVIKISLLAVCAGQTCIGHTLRRGKAGFQAFDADDRFPAKEPAR